MALLIGLLIGGIGGLNAWEVARAFIMLAWALGVAAFITGIGVLINLLVVALRKSNVNTQDSENKVVVAGLAILGIMSPIWVFILSMVFANR